MQEFFQKQLKKYDFPQNIKLNKHPIRYIQQLEKLILIISSSGSQELKQLQPQIDKIKTEIEKVKLIMLESKVVSRQLHMSIKVLLEFLKLQTNNPAIKNLLNFILDKFSDINWDELRNLLNKNILGFLQYPENQNELILQKGKTIIKLYKKFFQPKQGIKTDAQQVKRYLDILKEFALQEDQLNIIRRLNTPKGVSPKEMLKRLRYEEEEEDEESDEDQQTKEILTLDIFITLEKKLMSDGLINTDDALSVDLEHIHNKLIFDALNQALDYSRPYGLGSQPLPWKAEAYCLKQREIKEDQIDHAFQKGLKKVSEWAEVQPGIINKQYSSFPKILYLDQYYLSKLNQERLVSLLKGEINEEQKGWLNYDKFYTEINIELTEFLLDDLINELVREKF